MSSVSSTPAGNAVTPVRVWVASPAGCRALASAAEAARLVGGDSFTWIDLEETGDAGLRQISDVLDVGAEAFEMVRRAAQRPRFMPLTDATYAAVPVTNPSASQWCSKEAITHRCGLTGENRVRPVAFRSLSAS